MTDRTPMQRALDAEALVADLAKRVAELEAALKPFAYGNIDVSGAAVILGYPECGEALRVARDALAGKEPK